MQIGQPQFLLDLTFNKHIVPRTGMVIYWRDCVLQKDMVPATQGYLWVFSDGETFHSYRTPEQCDL